MGGYTQVIPSTMLGAAISMSNHTPEIVVGVWALFSLLIITFILTLPMTVYWGRPTGGVQAPMSRPSRVVFGMTLWLMVGVVASGMAGFRHARWFIAAFLVAVVLSFVLAAIDHHRWRKCKGRSGSSDSASGGPTSGA